MLGLKLNHVSKRGHRCVYFFSEWRFVGFVNLTNSCQNIYGHYNDVGRSLHLGSTPTFCRDKMSDIGFQRLMTENHEKYLFDLEIYIASRSRSFNAFQQTCIEFTFVLQYTPFIICAFLLLTWYNNSSGANANCCIRIMFQLMKQLAYNLPCCQCTETCSRVLMNNTHMPAVLVASSGVGVTKPISTR